MAGVIAVFSSCSGATKDDPGAVIEIYMPYSVSFDPAVAYADDASAKLMSLLYQGLTTIDSKGRVKGALADSWETYTNRDGEKVLEIKLKDTAWSDGQSVDAEDFLDSWERILDPEFNCEAASLLFSIKNAVDVKNGVLTLSDLGVTASTRDTLTIVLEDWADPDTFLRNCASVALYPIRRDVINKIYDRDTQTENDWSTLPAIMQTNGPFFLRRVSFGSLAEGTTMRPSMTLERNTSYYLDPDKNESVNHLDKYVVPYRIVVNMTYGNDDVADFVDDKMSEFISEYRQQHGVAPADDVREQILAAMSDEEKNSYGSASALEEAVNEMVDERVSQMVQDRYSIEYAADYISKITESKDAYVEMYDEGTILYNGGLPQSYDGKVVLKDMMITGSFYFNTDNELFADANVRKALSLALDREAIAEMVKYAKPADTLITDGVFETTRKTSFKENSDYGISTTQDLATAQSLLKSAGVTSGSFSISVRATEQDITIAQYAVEQWEKLGFDVSIRIYGYNLTNYTERELVATDERDENGAIIKVWQDVVIYEGLLHDGYNDAYNNADFDVIFYDVNMHSTDAFAALAQFAAVYSGRAYDFSGTSNFDELMTHVTGYYNPEYDEIMKSALVETDSAKRAQLLHEAEELLLTDMPVTPVIYYQNAYIVSDELDDYTTSYFGYTIFTEATYDNYVPTETQPVTEAPSTDPEESEQAA